MNGGLISRPNDLDLSLCMILLDNMTMMENMFIMLVHKQKKPPDFVLFKPPDIYVQHHCGYVNLACML